MHYNFLTCTYSRQHFGLKGSTHADPDTSFYRFTMLDHKKVPFISTPEQTAYRYLQYITGLTQHNFCLNTEVVAKQRFILFQESDDIHPFFFDTKCGCLGKCSGIYGFNYSLKLLFASPIPDQHPISRSYLCGIGREYINNYFNRSRITDIKNRRARIDNPLALFMNPQNLPVNR